MMTCTEKRPFFHNINHGLGTDPSASSNLIKTTEYFHRLKHMYLHELINFPDVQY